MTIALPPAPQDRALAALLVLSLPLLAFLGAAHLHMLCDLICLHGAAMSDICTTR